MNRSKINNGKYSGAKSKKQGNCHCSSFMTPLFTIPQWFLPTLLTIFTLVLLTTHTYEKGEDDKTYIETWQTTRNATLVGRRIRVGIPSHLLPVPLLDNLSIDQVSTTIQLPRKIVCRDPIHIGVPLWTDQWVQHHLDQHWRTLSRLEAATQQTHRHNGYWTQVRVKTSDSTILDLAPGWALPPRWSRKWSKDRTIWMDDRRNVPSLVETSKLEMPNINLHTTRRNVTADCIKLMLQLPNPNNCSLQESLLLHQLTVDQLVVLTAVELPVLNKD